MAYIFREMVRSRSRETSARGRKRRKGRFCSLRRQNWGKNEWPREGRRRYIDTCPRAPPEYRGLTRDHCEERWSLLSLINRPPTSPSFSSSCRGQIFHRVPVFPSIETSSPSFSSTLLPFLSFPSLLFLLFSTEGFNNFRGGGNVCENATSPRSVNERRRPLLRDVSSFFLAEKFTGWVGLIGGNRSFGNFLGGF